MRLIDEGQCGPPCAGFIRQLSDRTLPARAAEKARAAERKGLIGSGDRSERIRTYNYPQGRVTDHRINLTRNKLDDVMTGSIDELIAALNQEHQAEVVALQVE